MNKKLKKGLTTTMAAAMGLGVVIPAVPVIAAPATSGWVKTAAGWTYLKSGVKATGWVKDGGKWYFLDSNGIMKTGWVKDAGTWYYLTSSGAMATGWFKDADGKWYFLNTSGAMVENAWQGNYYLGSTGAMLVSTVTPDGYTVNADGAWDGQPKASEKYATLKAAVDAKVKAFTDLANGDLSTQALIDAAKVAAGKIDLTGLTSQDTLAVDAIVTAAYDKVDAAQKVIDDAKTYTELKAGVETKVAAYEAATADLSTQALVDAANAAKAVISLTGLTDADKAAFQTRIDAADAKVADAVAKLAVLKVDSVSAVKANTLTVKFNKAVEDTTKATFSVKVDGSVVAVQAATWNADKTEATLTKSVGKFVAGNYTVSVTGLTDSAVTGTATIDAETVSGVEIVGSNLVQSSDGQTGTVGLKVTNQYGEDITKSLANGSTDLTATVSVAGATGVFSNTTGLVTVDLSGTDTFAGKSITKLTLTVVHKATGKVASKELTVSDAARVGSFTVAQPELPTNATKFVQGAGYVLPVTANDQYGTAIEYAQAEDTSATGLSFISSATEVSNFQVNADGQITFDIGAVATTKDVTITVVNPATGDSKAVTFKIYAPAAADTATLTAPAVKFTTDYNGTPAYLVPISVVDQYGTKLTDDQVVAAYGNGDFTIVSTNPGIFTVPVSGAITKDSKLGAVINLSQVAKGTASLVLTVNGSAKTVTLPLTVVDPVAPVAFSVAPSATNLAVGATSTVKASFLDNDGLAVTSAAAYKVKYTVASADASKVNITNNDQSVADQIGTGTSIEATSDAAGKAITVTATLYNDATNPNVVDAGEAVDTKTFTLNVAATDATFTYGVKDIAKLSTVAAGSTASEYAQALTLTATDAAGNTVTIPQSRIVGATSSDTAVAVVDNTNGGWKVAGKAVKTAGTPSTAVITVLVQDNDGSVKTVQKTVTVSDEALVATSIDAYADSDTTDETPITEFAATTATLITGLKVVDGTDGNFKFVVTDQFGGTSLTPATYAVTGTSALDLGTGDSIGVASNTLTLTDADSSVTYNSSATQTLTITAATSNGLTKSVKIHQ